VRSLTDELIIQAIILGSFVALIWFLEILDQLLFRGRLNQLGIHPRTTTGLRGILLAPFLHGTWKHLITNTPPLIVLGWLVMWQQTNDFFIVTLITMLVSGLGVWLFGSPNTVHIGASGIVFGYFGFLLLRSYFEQNLISAIVSVVVALMYGNLIWGVLPIRRGVSWLGHLFGFVGGVVAARYLPELRQWLEESGILNFSLY
jgi:membrane associated rhomboid family serine protease